MSQPAKKVDLRSQMPATSKWVDERRAEWGRDHVNACIRDALAGVPGRFYAFEAGHVLGTPFPPSHAVAEWQAWGVVTGCTFGAFMAQPGGGADGKA